MPNAVLFVEDFAQEQFLLPLLRRLSAAANLNVDYHVRSAKGGSGKVLEEVGRFVAEIKNGRISSPDGIIIAVDANCRGYANRRDSAAAAAGTYAEFAIYAIPDPHIEKWLLLDSNAFKQAVGFGCEPPDRKCEKDRYKMALNRAVLNAGVQPLLGGVEYAEEIAQKYDVRRVAGNDESFGRFVGEFKTWANRLKTGSTGI